MFKRNPAKKMNPWAWKADAPMPWNIYGGEAQPCNEHMKKFDKFHYFIKYRVYVPALLVLERFTERHLDKAVPNECYNKNLQLFNDAWEQSIVDWNRYFLAINDPEFKKDPEAVQRRYAEHNSRTGSSRHLRTMKALMLSLALNDTAYREFFNIYVHNQALMTLKEYGGKGKVPHVFYTHKDIYDVVYLVMWKNIENGQMKVQLEQVNKPKEGDPVGK